MTVRTDAPPNPLAPPSSIPATANNPFERGGGEITIADPNRLWAFLCVACGTDLVPTSYRNNPARALVAAHWGARFGFDPLQAMQSVAVVNGKPSLYGDAGRALLLRREDLAEFRMWCEERGTDRAVGRCVIVRNRANGLPPVKADEAFTLAEARAAGLLAKDSPWKTYPGEMLQWRAFWRAARKTFADVLAGIAGAEDVYGERLERASYRVLEDEPEPVSRDTGTTRSTVSRDTGTTSSTTSTGSASASSPAPPASRMPDVSEDEVEERTIDDTSQRVHETAVRPPRNAKPGDGWRKRRTRELFVLNDSGVWLPAEERGGELVALPLDTDASDAAEPSTENEEPDTEEPGAAPARPAPAATRPQSAAAAIAAGDAVDPDRAKARDALLATGVRFSIGPPELAAIAAEVLDRDVRDTADMSKAELDEVRRELELLYGDGSDGSADA